MKLRDIIKNIGRERASAVRLQDETVESGEEVYGLTRCTLSIPLEKADPPYGQDEAKQVVIMDELSQLIWSKLENQAFQEDQFNPCYAKPGWVEQLPCEAPSMRQLNTAEWFIEQIHIGDKKAAFHYLNEYVDNYHYGFNKECSAYELQVIWMMIELIKIVG